MNPETLHRLLGFDDAFSHPVTRWITGGVVVVLLAAWGANAVFHQLGKIGPPQHQELSKRIRSWWILAPLMIGPVLLGAAWVIGAVAVLSILCHREFAHATGLFRNRLINRLVVLGILAVTFAVADHWYGFFVALPALGTIIISAVGVLQDQPKGYIQRVALGGFAFLLFGVCLGHLGYLANDSQFRPLLLLLLLAVEANDVFAYLSGKSFGKRKLAPNTSPNKTIGGALGAVIGTTTLLACLGHFVFLDSPMDHPAKLIGLGLVVSVAGQLGDLVLSSIKRDIGIKDMSDAIPGHGGLLDRFDSLVLVAPAFFHYVGYFRGIGLD